ncbi:DUF2480 family protein [Rapidithrix thailandica]|uniref:DUF2480 family protein n=1 Tax=Rapidithrix thailandica TaxID=413964 RepID=A0AAW9S5S9_9BACT
MEEPIVNRVAKSGLITLDLAEYYPQGERVLLDIKEQLFQGLLLREKDFRDYIKNTDWSQYQGQFVAVICSSDAIIPQWAYMLLSVKLTPHAQKVVFGTLEELEDRLFIEALQQIKAEDYQDKMVVIKGCGDIPVPSSAYVEIASKLQPFVKSIMYGEPCSTVPVYKKPRK